MGGGSPDQLPLVPYSSLQEVPEILEALPLALQDSVAQQQYLSTLTLLGIYPALASVQRSPTPSPRSSNYLHIKAVSRGNIHTVNHLCSLCLGYDMRIPRHAQTLDVQIHTTAYAGLHVQSHRSRLPNPSCPVISGAYLAITDPFGVSPVLAAIFKVTTTGPARRLIRACTPPTRPGAESCCRQPAAVSCLDAPTRYCFGVRLFAILQRCTIACLF